MTEDNVLEMMNLGIVGDNQWWSNQIGRKPALMELLGNRARDTSNLGDEITCNEDEVFHEKTGLCWKKCPYGFIWDSGECVYQGGNISVTREDAEEICHTYDDDSRAHVSSYRLPTLAEYAQLLPNCSFHPNDPDLIHCGTCADDAMCDAIMDLNESVTLFLSADVLPDPNGVNDGFLTMIDFEGNVNNTGYTSQKIPLGVGAAAPIRCVRDEQYILPNALREIPSESAPLRIAISLLDKYQIDFPGFAGGYKFANQTCSESYLHLALRTRVNSERLLTEQEPFSSIEELAENYGIEVDTILEAAKYMYAHTLQFPRKLEVVVDGNGNCSQTKIDGWSNPYMKVPIAWTLANFEKDGVLDENPAPYFEDDISWSDYLFAAGLEEHLYYVKAKTERDLAALRDRVNNGYQLYGQQELYEQALEQVIANVESYLPEPIEYLFRDSDGNQLKITRKNAIRDSSDEIVEHYRVYPVADESNHMQFENMICLHKDDDCEVVTLSPTIVTDNTTNETEWVFAWNDSVYPHRNWLVERRVGTGEGGEWKAVGALRKNIVLDARWTHGRFYTAGPFHKQISKVLSYNPNRLNGAICEGPNGECLDPDWVPAIQNEVINDGSQYETSYKYYLGLARQSAEEARAAREILMNDLIESIYSENLQNAQMESYVDNYVAEIKEICGDGLNEAEFRSAVSSCVSIDGDDIGPELEQCISDVVFGEEGRKFGCEYTDDGYIEDSPRHGPVQCSQYRNCRSEWAINLGDLGVLASEDTKRHTDSYLDYQLESGSYSFDALMDVNDIADCSGMIGADARDCFADKLNFVTEWSQKYRNLMAAVIKNQKIYAMPLVFRNLYRFQTGTSEFSSESLESLDAVGYNYGAYFDKLNQIASTIESVNAAASGYLSGIDEMGSAAQVLKSSLSEIETQAEFTIYDRLVTAQRQQAMYGDSLRSDAEICIREKRKQLGYSEVDGEEGGGEFSSAAIKSYLLSVDESFRNSGLSSFDDVNSQQEFMAICRNVVAGSVFGPSYADVVCDELEFGWEWDGSGNAWWDGNKSMDERYLAYYCDEEICQIGRLPWEQGSVGESTAERPSGIRIVCGDSFKHCDSEWMTIGWTTWKEEEQIIDWAERDQAEHYANQKSGAWKCIDKGGDDFDDYKKDMNKGTSLESHCAEAYRDDDGCVGKAYHPPLYAKDLCANNTYGYKISHLINDTMVQNIRDGIEKKLLKDCDLGENGCDIDYENHSVGDCHGISAAEYADAVAEWEDDGPNNNLYTLAQSLKNYSQDSQLNGFAQQMITIGRDMASQKAALSSNIRQLFLLIGELSSLEEAQIASFDRLINNRNLSAASTVTTLSEWETRFDWRKEDYERKLARARYQAWVALKAIEFRFGIKLHEETQSTPTMDAPNTWVTDLWDTFGTKCGQAVESSDTDNLNAIDNCLRKEDLIERYIDNLDDFVVSYGNNPTASTQWWFHEDDDTGVISLRDHIATPDVACPMTVSNMLFFTEEFNMDDAEASESYFFTWDELENSTETWEVSEATVGSVTISPDEVALDMPQEVLSANSKNTDANVFSDQQLMFSADRVEMPADSGEIYSISQTINKDKAEKAFYGNNLETADVLEFSVYHRQYPRESMNSCNPGEVYFVELGYCGTPCSFEEEDSDNIGSTCDAGQICMFAGDYFENGEQKSGGNICDWCTADQACVGQDAQAAALSIVDGNLNIKASRNISISNSWENSSVSTLDANLVTMSPNAVGGSEVMVEISNIKSKNYLPCSESFSHADCGWNGYQFVNEYGAFMERSTAPDGTMSGSHILSILSQDSYWVSGIDIPLDAGVTFSIWAKSEYDENLQIGFRLLDSNNMTLDTVKTTYSLTPGWKRYVAELPPSEIDFSSVFTVAPIFGTYHPSGYEVWGAQLETGLGASPYMAVGKNLLTESSTMNNWTLESSQSNCEDDGGKVVGEHCWFIASYMGQTCTEVCASHGGYNISGMETVAGVSGTSDCSQVASQFACQGTCYWNSQLCDTANGDVITDGFCFGGGQTCCESASSPPLCPYTCLPVWEAGSCTGTAYPVSSYSCASEQRFCCDNGVTNPTPPVEAFLNDSQVVGCALSDTIPSNAGSISNSSIVADEAASDPSYRRFCACNANSTSVPSEQVASTSNIKAPDKTIGAVVMEDTSELVSQSFTTTVSNLNAGSYTFSVWMKREAGVVNIPSIEVVSSSGDYIDLLLEDISDNWQRFGGTVACTDGGNITMRIYPADESDAAQGSIYLWGAQLEKGDTATGYQATGADSSSSWRDDGLDVGFVAAKLVPLDNVSCSDSGAVGWESVEVCEAHYLGAKDNCCASVNTWYEDLFSSYEAFYYDCITCSGDCTALAAECNEEVICSSAPIVASADATNQCVGESIGYRRNTYLREHTTSYCNAASAYGSANPLLDEIATWPTNEVRSDIFKSQFVEAYDGNGSKYYSYTFALDINKIELADTMGQFGVIAPNNFNYRIRTIAANVVGTDVLNCAFATAPSTCAANQWLSYDLSQAGPLRVKNHRGESFYAYNVPMGYIRGGKAWAAEQVIGYPISGTHQGALAQLQKIALMGRPIDGTFELRIYDTPELQWENVEDIQLVLGYHYWTKSE
ncbi:MAG: hypothetical protein JXX29_09745 [Deltaproteobacteria bacterium]|nr:hypothetical protein [Deltaproteobacteria bacterium]